MATNFFFRNYDASNEQNLLHDLIIEAIRIYGEDMYYVPRTLNSYDSLLGEDARSSYGRGILVEMYIKSVDGFTGDGNFMSKFGLQIRDQVVFSISQRVFSMEVGASTQLVRPNEGDLVFFPLNNKCFQIKYVKKQEMFYPLGTLPTWELTCELFEYSNEVMDTGIAEIDKLQNQYSTNIYDWALLDESGLVLTDESGDIIVVESYNLSTLNPAADNDAIQFGGDNFPIGSDDFIDFTEKNPFAENNY
jgi:hypothetical protein